MRKLIIVAVVLALLAGGGYYAWKRFKTPEAPAEAPATGTVERGPLRLVVASTGKVVSNLDVEIKSKASGEVTRLPYDDSDPVRKGELLLQLDPTEMQRLVDQAHATLSASEARLINARENLAIAEEALVTDRQKAESALKAAEAQAADAKLKAERIKDLLSKKLASQEEYDTAATSAVQADAALEQAKVKLEELKTQERSLGLSRQQIRIAEAQVENDKLALDLAREKLEDTKVYSPMDGVVTARNVQIGTIISSGISNVGGGTTALTVSDLSHIFVVASVDEADIGKVAVGQPVEITVDAFPGRRFKGEVVRIATKGVNVSNVVTFEVKIEVLSKDKGLLRPEMTANVDVIAAERADTLSVPSEALIRKEGAPHVTVVKAGTGGPGEEGAGEVREDRPVETGISDGVRTEVVSGVSEGETVIVYKNGADSRWRGGGFRPPFLGGGRH